MFKLTYHCRWMRTMVTMHFENKSSMYQFIKDKDIQTFSFTEGCADIVHNNHQVSELLWDALKEEA